MSTTSIVLHVIGTVLIYAAGFWTHYRFGSKVASTIALVETDIKKLKS
jgi:hypothetical protein